MEGLQQDNDTVRFLFLEDAQTASQGRAVGREARSSARCQSSSGQGTMALDMKTGRGR